MKNMNKYENCLLCPRKCGINRSTGQTGVCGVSSEIKVARAALHYWEEPCISGKRGSGAVFFSGCSLHCVFCQNREISDGKAGKVISKERLSDIFIELADKGANNINLVTPGQYIPDIVWAVNDAKSRGMKLPIIYNTSGYENVTELKLLEGIVDVYLPDFKYMDSTLSARYSRAKDYPSVAKQAISEMVRQQPDVVIDDATGLIQKGVIVRQLLLPGHVNDAKRISAPALYAMQYIVTASLGKLYTFTVTEEVLHELERHIHTYIAANTEKRFKSLEILEIMS